MGVLLVGLPGRHDLGRGRRPLARPRRPPAPRWRARRPASASGPPRSSPWPRPARRPVRSTRSHDSLTATGGGAVLVNMMLGEIAPGGVGAGLYGILVMAILAVFVAGLMVGRTPELLGKKISAQRDDLRRRSTCSPRRRSCSSAPASPSPRDSSGRRHGQPGRPRLLRGALRVHLGGQQQRQRLRRPHASPRTSSRSPLGLAMLVGRLLPIVLVLLLAGSLAEQGKVPATAGTLPTHTPLFVGLLVGVILVMTGLTYFPALALGPIAEALVMSTDLAPRAHAAAPAPRPAARGRPRRSRKLDPRHMWRSPVMFLVAARLGRDHRRGGRRPQRLHGLDHRLALAHGALRQPRRGGRRGPRQGAGRLAARRPHRHRRPAARRRRLRVGGARDPAGGRRPGGRRGRRGHPRRRRHRRGHRVRRRVGDHRRVRPGHPRGRRRPQRRHRRHPRAVGPHRRAHHRRGRARPSSTG